ncbi:MAG: ABC transporter ATP-binding protein [Candidatus Omnitrophota bacterium]
MLEAKGVTKVYRNGARELRVLKGINLSVRRGEVVSVVGPSGAGKSTLLHILGGLDEPTQGEVIFDNAALSSLDDRSKAHLRNRRFGFVFQFYHLLQEFSALENVMLPGWVDQGTVVLPNTLRDRAHGLFDFLGLSQRVGHRPSELSGGEQQRVAIARALINEPEVLFCDEPTGNLDSEAGKQVLSLLLRLNREKKTTVVMVTHSQDLAQGSHRILPICDGMMEVLC